MNDPSAMARIQFMVDYMDGAGILMDGCFTFPDGTTIWATGKEPETEVAGMFPASEEEVYQHSMLFEDSV